MNDDALFALLQATADAVAEALAATPSRQLVAGSRSLHHSDLATDAAALAVLQDAGVRVLSEESGLTGPAHAEVTVVVDPLDGSTNAAAGLPWYATSLCAVDERGPRVAVVRNLATGECFAAVRGEGATVDGAPLRSPVDRTEVLGDALVLLSGHARAHLGWRQYRAMGALALDLCAVAAGRMDAYLDCSVDAHGVWDYLGGVLIAREAGIDVCDVHGRELVVLDPAARRTPVAGPPLLREALRRRWPEASGEPLRDAALDPAAEVAG
ncbi:MAG: inositol monophosphatase [Acidimicrobiales bacterium]|nr:inositol monophosphatase [Acidimicrobiales bacterium]